MCEKLSKLQLSKVSNLKLLHVLNVQIEDLGQLEPDECHEIMKRFAAFVVDTEGDGSL